MTTDGPNAHAISLDEWPSPICHVEVENVDGRGDGREGASECEKRDGGSAEGDGGSAEGDGDSALVRTVNASFESAFGPVAAGDPVAGTLSEIGFDVGDLPPDVTEFVTGDAYLPVRLPAPAACDGPAEAYLLRGVTSDSTPGGYLVFTPLPPDASRERPSSGIGLEDVASAISHDLRNPLDVATARLRAARELDDGDEHLEHVARAHDRMERLIEDVLTLAGTADAVDPDGAVDPGAVAETAWATVRTDDARLEVAADLPPTVADEGRLQRLFENLFRNSVEHGPARADAGRASDGAGDGDREERPGMTVAVGRLDDDSADGFYVADDGRGIPGDRRERVFDPGVSADDHGTGLGLAIVDRIVDRHGWSIGVTASASGGARFEISGVTFATDP